MRIALPFQTIETVNESAQERQRSLELSSVGREPEVAGLLFHDLRCTAHA
ncbi:hypothetical protein MYX77_05815 [Acidobacteriia bacterium AH_259_A11_L15]|nr:hypothetical protein [Acidobacteriia bacterium AH_259_A11_L15]